MECEFYCLIEKSIYFKSLLRFFQVPVVQIHKMVEKPNKVLTQLGAIRKQLQLEHLQITDD